MQGDWTVVVDSERCIGSGSCAFAAPDVFDVDDSGRAVVVGPVSPGDTRVRDAIESCPMNALVLTEMDA